MKVYNGPSEPLHPDLAHALTRYRAARSFDPADYLAAKTAKLHAYMAGAGLHTVVVGVSGGIDSAVTLALVEHTRRRYGSPTPMAALLPAHAWDGVTRQTDAERIAHEVTDALGVETVTLDIAPVVSALVGAVKQAGMGPGTPWSRGQVTATTRTPILYYLTSLLTEAGRPALVGGTTNLDEGSYLGYVGKASDGMVDLQLISDLHKSEVYALARHLRLPDSVLAAVPDGDMYDGRPDEAVFGAPYDAVELLRHTKLEDAWPVELAAMSASAQAQWSRLSQHLEKLHDYNAHKYLVGSPAVHLDVQDAFVPGGRMR